MRSVSFGVDFSDFSRNRLYFLTLALELNDCGWSSICLIL